MKIFLSVTAIAILALAPAAVWGSPIGAKAVYVRGSVYAEPAEGARTEVAPGHAFSEGDKVYTAEDGVVEIMLDNGNLIRLDHKSEFVIKSLRRNEETKTTSSVFSLIFGRVKSSVARLATQESRFEYVTKAAIVGVAGTPPWVLEFDGETAMVDLLGMEGEEGSVYVKGFDAQETIVYLLANMGTVVRSGFAPQPPFQIPMERRRFLDRIIPFSFQQDVSKGDGQPSPPAQEAGSRQETEQEPPSAGPSVTESLVAGAISNSVSMPVKPAGASVDSISGASRMTSSEQGTVGEVGAGQQAPSTAQFQIQVNF